MADEALLDRTWADAVTRARDHVVVAPDEAEVAVGVLLRLVAREEPAVANLVGGRVVVAPVAEEHDGIALHADARCVLDDAHVVAGIGQPHRARARLPGGGVADEEIRLRLPVELVQPGAEPLAAPGGGLLPDRLPAARHRPPRDGPPRGGARHAR